MALSRSARWSEWPYDMQACRPCIIDGCLAELALDRAVMPVEWRRKEPGYAAARSHGMPRAGAMSKESLGNTSLSLGRTNKPPSVGLAGCPR